MGLEGRDLVSILDLSREEVEELFRVARVMEERPGGFRELLRGRILACLFFEPSTRTRLSFEAAMKRLGGSVIGFAGVEATSIMKGEGFEDTVRVVDAYCDAMVIRHPLEGSARRAAELAEAPVINAGDGANEHPTQALLDLYTVW
ncbi:MAG: aspartate carbamoyltransferase, partial [Candidatus Nezhaarchaeota archaeon]|nr:aspartate carbamoyltransferase [Candidatus Nezhaarchaeota archaeon]